MMKSMHHIQQPQERPAVRNLPMITMYGRYQQVFETINKHLYGNSQQTWSKLTNILTRYGFHYIDFLVTLFKCKSCCSVLQHLEKYLVRQGFINKLWTLMDPKIHISTKIKQILAAKNILSVVNNFNFGLISWKELLKCWDSWKIYHSFIYFHFIQWSIFFVTLIFLGAFLFSLG